jgi:pimeloyl-ACP methyl ester carboxylesterase
MKMPRLWKKGLWLLLGGGLCLWIMLRWFEHSQVYRPGRVLDATGDELGRPFEDIIFAASDGVELNGWFFPANINSPRASLAVLFCHGNGGNISHRLHVCQALLETGVSVFLFDYRGYGRSRGRPSEEGTYRDAAAACRWLQRKGFATTNVVAFGESLGGGVASELASRETLGGLILQSTFTSIPDIGAELFPWLPVRLVSSIRYDTCRRLPRLRIPILVMHSRTDDLIAFHHAERNFASANQPKLFWEIKGGHNDPLADRAVFVAGIEKFLPMLETAGSPVSLGQAK